MAFSKRRRWKRRRTNKRQRTRHWSHDHLLANKNAVIRGPKYKMVFRNYMEKLLFPTFRLKNVGTDLIWPGGFPLTSLANDNNNSAWYSFGAFPPLDSSHPYASWFPYLIDFASLAATGTDTFYGQQKRTTLVSNETVHVVRNMSPFTVHMEGQWCYPKENIPPYNYSLNPLRADTLPTSLFTAGTIPATVDLNAAIGADPNLLHAGFNALYQQHNVTAYPILTAGTTLSDLYNVKDSPNWLHFFRVSKKKVRMTLLPGDEIRVHCKSPPIKDLSLQKLEGLYNTTHGSMTPQYNFYKAQGPVFLAKFTGTMVYAPSSTQWTAGAIGPPLRGPGGAVPSDMAPRGSETAGFNIYIADSSFVLGVIQHHTARVTNSWNLQEEMRVFGYDSRALLSAQDQYQFSSNPVVRAAYNATSI